MRRDIPARPSVPGLDNNGPSLTDVGVTVHIPLSDTVNVTGHGKKLVTDGSPALTINRMTVPHCNVEPLTR